MRNYRFTALIAIVLLAFLSCTPKSQSDKNSPANQAKKNINDWMISKSTEYPEYKSIEFGELTPRYQKNSKTYQLLNLIEEEKSKTNPSQNTLDSLENLLKSNLGEFLGYTIVHKYQTKNVAGETIENENLFFLDSLFRIITVLNADAYDQIMDEKLIFRQESIDSLKK